MLYYTFGPPSRFSAWEDILLMSSVPQQTLQHSMLAHER